MLQHKLHTTNKEYRQSKLSQSKLRYKANVDLQNKNYKKKQYNDNAIFQMKAKQVSKEKYRSEEEFNLKVKQYSFSNQSQTIQQSKVQHR